MEERKERIADTALFEYAMDREERHIKRLMWIIVFMIACWITTVAVFVWYISLPVEETVTTQTVDDIDNSNIKQIVGDDYGESSTDSTESTESNKK